jgi:hypothetical protein
MNTYNSLRISAIERPTNISQIKKFEILINAQLPRCYIDFLLKYNGGRPICDTYDLIEHIDKDYFTEGISWFYALYDGYDCNIKTEYGMFKDRIPSDLIPIASAPCGNQICLCVKGVNYGKVYFWDHENEAPEGEEPWYENVYLIANSFKEFIDKLYETELDENNNLVRVDSTR